MDKRKNNGGHKTNGGRKSVKQELRGVDLASPHIEESFIVIASIMKNPNEHTRDRIAAAKLLIAYGCGNPKETIETTHNVTDFDIKKIFQIGSDND